MVATPVTAVAIDVDGTLIDPEHRVTPGTLAAVAALQAAGVRVVLASARFPLALAQFGRDLGLAGEPIVACQGAVWGTWGDRGTLRDTGERPITTASAMEVTRMARTMGLWVSWYTASDWFVQTGDRMVGQEEDITGVRATRVASWADVGQVPAKLCVIAEEDDVHLIPTAQGRLPADVTGVVSRPDYLEVAARGVSKWGGIRAALAPLGIQPEHTVAIGDGDNDLEMISGAGIGIAMGNASDKVKAVADWVAPPNSEDGFAAAVDWLLSEPHGA